MLKRSLPSRTLPVPPCSNSTRPVPVPKRCPGALGTLWGPPQEDCFALGHVNHELIPSDLKSPWPAFKIWFLQPAPLNPTKTPPAGAPQHKRSQGASLRAEHPGPRWEPSHPSSHWKLFPNPAVTGGSFSSNESFGQSCTHLLLLHFGWPASSRLDSPSRTWQWPFYPRLCFSEVVVCSAKSEGFCQKNLTCPYIEQEILPF